MQHRIRLGLLTPDVGGSDRLCRWLLPLLPGYLAHALPVEPIVWSGPPSAAWMDWAKLQRLQAVHVVTPTTEGLRQRVFVVDSGTLKLEHLHPYLIPEPGEASAGWMPAVESLLASLTATLGPGLSLGEPLALPPLYRSAGAVQKLLAARQMGWPVPQRLQAVRDTLDLQPDLAEAYADLGRLLKQAGQPTDSVQAYAQAIQKTPGGPWLKAEYTNHAAIVSALIPDLASAVTWWQKATHWAPRWEAPYLSLAHAYESRNQLTDARNILLAALRQGIFDSRVHACLAQLYAKQDAWSMALEQYLFQLRLEGSDPWIHCNIAMCHLQLGEAQSAKEAFQQASLLDPDSEAAAYAKVVLEQLTESVA